jgi:alpha-tubulin suppressor-like RCC1 family protein
VTTGDYHSCAVRSIGKLYCWGGNDGGQVGFTNGGADVLTPTKITTADDWRSISAGGNHTCAIRSVGKLYCWGVNGNGQAGIGRNDAGHTSVTTPTKITTADDWKTVDAGSDFTCAIRSVGKLYGWGDNVYGQLGFNTGGANVLTPTQVTSP